MQVSRGISSLMHALLEPGPQMFLYSGAFFPAGQVQ